MKLLYKEPEHAIIVLDGKEYHVYKIWHGIQIIDKDGEKLDVEI